MAEMEPAYSKAEERPDKPKSADHPVLPGVRRESTNLTTIFYLILHVSSENPNLQPFDGLPISLACRLLDAQ
jgi:hypothetical protein